MPGGHACAPLFSTAIVTSQFVQKARKILHMCDWTSRWRKARNFFLFGRGSEHFFRLPPSLPQARNESLSVNVPFSGSIGRRRRSDGQWGSLGDARGPWGKAEARRDRSSTGPTRIQGTARRGTSSSSMLLQNALPSIQMSNFLSLA